MCVFDLQCACSLCVFVDASVERFSHSFCNWFSNCTCLFSFCFCFLLQVSGVGYNGDGDVTSHGDIIREYSNNSFYKIAEVGM